MSPTSAKLQADKFDGTNYRLWSYKMEMYLRAKGLWEHVEESVEADPILNGKAQAEIVMALSDGQLMHCIHAKSAKMVWMILKRINERKDVTSKMMLKEKFATFKYSGGNMSKHVEDLERLILSMDSAGCRPDEDDVCMTLLRSLPSQYESLVQAIRINMVKFSFIDIAGKIASEELRQQDSESTSEQVAMQAKIKKGKTGKKPQSKANVVCYKCGKRGHYKNECRSKDQGTYNSGESNVAFTAHAKPTRDQATADCWVIDSGASMHMCSDRSAFKTYTKQIKPQFISVAKSNTRLKVLGSGSVSIKIRVGQGSQNATLEDTLHVENLSRNLFSISAITKKGMEAVMNRNGCEIKKNGKILATGSQIGSLTYLDTERDQESYLVGNENDLWHRRFGHIAKSSLINMMKNGQLSDGVEPGKVEDICEVCEVSKQSKARFPKKNEEIEDNTDHDGVVCSDIMGPITPASVSGSSYAVTFIDMKSRFIKVYPMKKKSDMMNKFKDYKLEMATTAKFKIRILRSDNGGEYRSKAMEKYCKSVGIRQEFTVPHNPEQNGMAERANRTLIEMARCMIQDSGMDKKYWAEALVTAAYTRNMVSTSTRPGTTPYQDIYKKKPDHHTLRIFGSLCYAHIPKANRKKLDNSGVKSKFLGYASEQKGYRLLDPSNGSVFFSRSVKWHEMPPSSTCNEVQDEEYSDVEVDMKKEKKSMQLHEEHSDEEADTKKEKKATQSHEEHSDEGVDMKNEKNPMQAQDEYSDEEGEMPNRQDQRNKYDSPGPAFRTRSKEAIRKEHQAAQVTKPSDTPNRYGEKEANIRPARKKMAIVRYQDEFDGLMCLAAEVNDEDATTYKQIMKSEDKSKWQEAMDAEMKSIMQHETWELVELPKNKKAIGCRWLFKVKKNADGTVNKYKARLCAKGFTQRLGVDFTETFAPVAKMTSIRTMLAIAAEKDLEIQQFDIDTAFLYGKINEELYMDQPDGYVNEDKPKYVCKLKKSLYGTKQAARQWNEALDKHMKDQDFKSANADPCIYTRIDQDEYTIVAVYVDDIIVMSQDIQVIEKFKEKLKCEFKIKDLGDMKFCLGIDVDRNRKDKTITMSQLGYINKIAERFGLLKCKPIFTPADMNSKLEQGEVEEDEDNDFPYRELVGSLMYAMVCTRPDIANAVGTISKHCEKPSRVHWIAAKRVLRYLVTTKNMKIKFGSQPRSELVGYADANWASDADTRRSTTGYLFTLNNSVVSWKSQRQHTVATSSTEAEYMALYSAVQEMIWLRRLLKDLKYIQDKPTMIYQDNQGTIALAKNPTFHSRTKHIDIKYHFVRDKIKSSELVIEYKATQEMVADALTKPVSKVKIYDFIKQVNMQDATRAEKEVQVKHG